LPASLVVAPLTTPPFHFFFFVNFIITVTATIIYKSIFLSVPLPHQWQNYFSDKHFLLLINSKMP
jgi:hypothetical protein